MYRHSSTNNERNRRLSYESLESRRVLASVTVSNSSDVVDWDEVGGIADLIADPGDDGTISLREAILAANNTLNIGGPDIIDFNFDFVANDTISLAAGQLPTIEEDLTITGPGLNVLTIDAQNSSRIFRIDDFVGGTILDVTIEGLTLANGNGSGSGGTAGGAILSDESLTLKEMRFESNSGRNGGAVHVNAFGTGPLSLTVSNSEFEGNQANGAIGGSGNGGAIHVSNDVDVSLSGVTAWLNQANDQGGVMFVSGSNSEVTVNGSSVFHTNSAGGHGGAISVSNGEALTIESSTFGVDPDIPSSQGNTSARNGGALYWTGRTSGIDDDVRDVYIHDSLFEGNTADSAGGGLYLVHGDFEKSEIVDTVVRDNHLVGGTGQARNGGGIFISTSGRSVLLDNVIVESNSAGLWTDASGTATSGGGGIRFGSIFDGVNDVSVTIQYSRITNNETWGSGGGLSADLINGTFNTNSLRIKHTIVEDNRSHRHGGGLFIDNGEAEGVSNPTHQAGVFELVDSEVTGNRVHVDQQFPDFGSKGGGLYLQSWSTIDPRGMSTISGTTFADNESSGGGGGIHASVSPLAPLTIRDSAIHNNDTNGDGGGLELVIGPGNASLEDRVLVLNTTVAKNTAKNGGGIATDGLGTLFAHSTITDNVAGPLRFRDVVGGEIFPEAYTSGGGIYFTGFRSAAEQTAEVVTLDHMIVAGNAHMCNQPEATDPDTGNDVVTCRPDGENFIGSDYSPEIGTSGGYAPSAWLADDSPLEPLETLYMRYTIIGIEGGPLSNFSDVPPDIIVAAAVPGDGLQNGDTSQIGYSSPNEAIPVEALFQLDGEGRPKLADNGGPTKTVALGTGSIAIDQGDPAFDATDYTPDLDFDQRGPGFRRVEDIPGVGSTKGGVDHFIDIGAYEVQHLLRVIDVTISGSMSQHDPYSFAEDMLDPSWKAGDQLKTVPVGGLDTVAITFNKPVIVNADHLDLIGLRTGNEPYVLDPTDPEQFKYDPDTLTATWELFGWALGDHFVIKVDDLVATPSGELLDGNWTNPDHIDSTSSTGSNLVNGSGDGTAGGEFQFVVTLLPGDANRDALINFQDAGILSGTFGEEFGMKFENADFTGDGAVNFQDAGVLSGRFGDDLRTLLVAGDIEGNDYQLTVADRVIIETNKDVITSGATYEDGDLDGDGEVNQDDLDMFDALQQAFADFGLNLTVA